VDAGGEDVEEEQGLERPQVAGLEQEAAELGVEVPVERLVARGEDGDAAPADGVLERLQQERLVACAVCSSAAAQGLRCVASRCVASERLEVDLLLALFSTAL
jgi:hypothetical protein